MLALVEVPEHGLEKIQVKMLNFSFTDRNTTCKTY